jgi:hypothetical protein
MEDGFDLKKETDHWTSYLLASIADGNFRDGVSRMVRHYHDEMRPKTAAELGRAPSFRRASFWLAACAVSASLRVSLSAGRLVVARRNLVSQLPDGDGFEHEAAQG